MRRFANVEMRLEKFTRRKCLHRRLHLDILWLPRAAMKTLESDGTDCVLIVGVSRPKLALAFLSFVLLSLFITFHILYDSAVSTFQQTNGPQSIARRYANPAYRHAPSSVIRIHFPKTMRRLPQAIIIGVRKCGTRALLEMLFLHPMIQKAAGEVHFFDRDENYQRGLEWYRKKMPFSFKGQITIEKSPSYFVTPEVPERIRAMNASIKLLLIVREPVTRAISDYTQLRSHATSTSSPTTLPKATTPSKSFEQLVLHPNGTINESYKPLSISMYHTYIHRWFEVFPKEQIFLVNGDQLIEDPFPQLQRIERFLGIEPRIARHNFYFNETKGFFCIRNDTMEKCLKETKGRRHPRVDPFVIGKLRKFYGDHNQKFYELMGEDLGWPED